MIVLLTPVAVLVVAFSCDIVAGDPPNRYHPVAWMGSAIAWYRRRSQFASPKGQFLSGLTLVVVGVVVVAGIGWSVERICLELPFVVSVVVQALLLKCTFTARSLARAASAVQLALAASDISLARHEVAYHLVSRDTSTLGPSELAAATIESVAENASDSIVAPLFFYAVFGLPGALVYRFVNTCDAMIGYHTDELEWFGKASARFDDLLNFIPSRITAIVMITAGVLNPDPQAGRISALRIWWRDHALTLSPNAGHPMSAAAGVLGVALEKRDHYRMGGELPDPSAATISAAIKLLWTTATITVLVLAAALVLERLS